MDGDTPGLITMVAKKKKKAGCTSHGDQPSKQYSSKASASALDSGSPSCLSSFFDFL